MPLINELGNSKFLKKEEVGNGLLVTIAGCTQENVAMEDQAKELKWTLTFEEDVKPLVLNVTNGSIIASILGSDNTDDWTGGQIILFNDPSIMFKGKRTGGIRVRAPEKQTGRMAEARPGTVTKLEESEPPF
jgi:hypothetical protein